MPGRQVRERNKIKLNVLLLLIVSEREQFFYFPRIESAAEIIKIIKVILQYWISAQDL